MHSNHEFFWRIYELNEYLAKICMHSLLRPLPTGGNENRGGNQPPNSIVPTTGGNNNRDRSQPPNSTIPSIGVN